MHRSQRILLKPTFKQRKLFAGAVGLTRFAWNWAVALCQRHYRMFGKREGYQRPSMFSLRNHWNKIKKRRSRLSWVGNYSKFIPEQSFKNFDVAMEMAFDRLRSGEKAGFPKFHRKGSGGSFNVLPSGFHNLRIKNNCIRIPCVGMVRIQSPLRWPTGKQVYAQVKLKSGRWWIGISYDLPNLPKLSDNRPSCGIDLGCATFATVASGGEIVDEVLPPKPYAKAKRKLKRLCRVMNRRRVKGKKQSGRYKQARLKMAKVHERVANVRKDFLHNLTARLAKRFGTIVIEDLSVKGMMAGFLSGTIADLGFGEFRRQLTYKCEATGTKLVVADRFYPSSKTCHRCGFVRKEMKLSERVLWCQSCGEIIERDHNAAFNLEKLPVSDGEDTHAESGGPLPKRKPKQGAARRSVNANKPVA